MSDQTFVAIDLGAESGRVMRARVGKGISLKEIHRFPNGVVRAGDTLFWDILFLWNQIQTGLARVGSGQTPAGIGVDAWGVDFALVDADGSLIGNPVHYRDTRTVGVPDQLYNRIARQDVYNIAGLQTIPFNSVFQLYALAQKQPAQLAAAKHLLFIPDLLNYWLCGALANEYTVASTSQMLNARTRDWSLEIIAAAGAPRSLFPHMVMPGQSDGVLGPVHSYLPLAGTPVLAVGSHDTASAVAAVPAEGDDWLYLSSGTWSLLGAEVDQPVLTEKAMRYNLTNEGGVGGRIRLLRNIAGLWLLQECMRSWKALDKDISYTTLVEEATSAAPGTAMLDPDHASFVLPGNMPEKIAAYCRETGQPAPASRGQCARVILESLAAAYARVKTMLEDATGKTFKRLHIVGGGSRNDLLNQLAANATGLTVFAGPVEATALGNVVAQAMATGLIGSLEEGRLLVARSCELKRFDPR